ncbi:MAG: hypothetical protein EZS28_003056 [Streblomastix strix]|uniref:TmcB/TmcC TPR repeats domain-containing protein n=1 Tax=Streblomastix strix TaxID=222440 RepID=A0A5J4X244_9EUKA|nr:MAG: hypothetical protein EZS28_003056 [Streblomastix strix]
MAQQDEKRSTAPSTQSTRVESFAKASKSDKVESLLFTLLLPLYDQPRRELPVLTMILWVFKFVEMIAFALFRTDPGTNKQPGFSMVVNFASGTSIGLAMGKLAPIISILALVLLIIVIAAQVICTMLYQPIIQMQPWILSVLRGCVETLLSALYIPLITNAITTFDCFKDEEGKNIWRADVTIQCLSGNVLHIIGFIIGIVFLLCYLSYSVVIRIFIFNYNPKSYSIFTCKNSTFNVLETVLTFGICFAMRMLVEWPFWRGIVTVGTSLTIVIIIYWYQPYFKYISNVLTCILWTMFGSIRLCLEVGYSVTRASHSEIPQYFFLAAGVAIGVVLCAIAIYFIKDRAVSLFLINRKFDTKKMQYIPKIKTISDINPSTRFLQYKEMRTKHNLDIVDSLYVQQLQKHKNEAQPLLEYSLFQSQFLKNKIKATAVLKRLTDPMLNTSLPLRFILFCQRTTEVSGSQSGGSQDNAEQSITFQNQMGLAEEHYENAKVALKKFFEEVLKRKPNFSQLPTLLGQIVDQDAASRKIFEELMSQHHNNVQVIRRYAKLLRDVYNETETADELLQRAEMVEELGDHHQFATITQQASGGQGGGFDDAWGAIDAIATDNKQSPQFDDKNSQLSGKSRKSKTSGRSSHKRKKKGKKIFGLQPHDPALKELQGIGRGSSGGDDGDASHITGVILLLAVSIPHIMIILSFIVCIVIYSYLAGLYKTQLANMEKVCSMAGVMGRAGSYSLQLLWHYYKYEYNASRIQNDGNAITIVTLSSLLNSHALVGSKINDIISQLYELTSHIGSWEIQDITVYEPITNQNQLGALTANGQKPKVIEIQQQQVNLLRLLTMVSQKESLIGAFGDKGDGKELIKHSSLLSDETFIILNSCVPALQGVKRSMLVFYEETQNISMEQLIIVILIITIVAAFAMVILLIAVIVGMRSVEQERENAFRALINLPRNLKQSVIRRLLHDERVEEEEEEVGQNMTNIQIANNEIEVKQEQEQDIFDQDQQLLNQGGKQYQYVDNILGNMENIEISRAETDEPEQQQQNSNFEQYLNKVDEKRKEQQPDEEDSILAYKRLQKSGTSYQLDRQISQGSIVDKKNRYTFTMKEETYTQISHRSEELKKGKGVSQLLTGKWRREVITLACEAVHADETIKQINRDMEALKKVQEEKRLALEDKQKQMLEKKKQKKEQDEQNIKFSDIKDAEEKQKKLKALNDDYDKYVGIQQKALLQLDKISLKDQDVLTDKQNEQEELIQQLEDQITEQFEQSGLKRHPQHVRVDGSYGPNWLAVDGEDLTHMALVTDEEANEQDPGFVRNELPDVRWESKIDTQITDLRRTFNNLPSPLTVGLVLPVFISLLLILVSSIIGIVVVAVSVYSIYYTSTSMFLSGLVPSALGQMTYLNHRLVMDFTQLELPDNQVVEFSDITNPVWNDSSHLSSNRTHILNLLHKSSKYFTALLSATNFGMSSNDEFEIGDSMASNLEAQRLSVDSATEILLKNVTCFSVDDPQCEAVNSKRIYHVAPPFWGLTTLTSRVELYIEQMNHKSENDIKSLNESSSYVRFLASAMREDIRRGIEILIANMLKNTQSSVQYSSTTFMITEIVCSFVVFVTFLINACSWQGRMHKASIHSHCLLRLLPEEEETQIVIEGQEQEGDGNREPLTLLPVMRTNFEPYDKGRELILEAARAVIDAMTEFESEGSKSFNGVLVAMRHLITSVKKQFAWEEHEMCHRVGVTEFEVKRKIDEMGKNPQEDPDVFGVVKLNEHQQSHIIIRQRLTLLYDSIHTAEKNKKGNEQEEVDEQENEGKGKDAIKKKPSFSSRLWHKFQIYVLGASDNSHICAVQTTAKYALQQLFDSHFSEEDIEVSDLLIRLEEKDIPTK